MSVTLGFVLRVGQAPASMMPSVQVAPAQPVIDVRPLSAEVQPLRHAPNNQWHRNSSGQFMNQAVTYNARGRAHAEDIQGTHLDIFV